MKDIESIKNKKEAKKQSHKKYSCVVDEEHKDLEPKEEPKEEPKPEPKAEVCSNEQSADSESHQPKPKEKKVRRKRKSS